MEILQGFPNLKDRTRAIEGLTSRRGQGILSATILEEIMAVNRKSRRQRTEQRVGYR
jgi:hypothetical protein